MKIKILTYNDAVLLSGSYTTVVDLFLNLRGFVEVEFNTFVDHHAIAVMRCFTHHKFFGDPQIMSGFTKKLDHTSEIVIMTCEMLFVGVEWNVQCDKLILLDTLDLQRANHIPSLMDVGISCDECILLGNPSNEHILPFKMYEYYHKFNPIRLNSRSLPKETFNYCRTDKEHIQLSDGSFFENVGKAIFENIYHGNEVNYDPRGIRGIDGLCYYLELFGVDPYVEHNPLKITRDDVIDKLFFDKNDKILEVL